MSRKKLSSSRANEDDSPYVSAADFFSLISLTLIFVILAFPTSAPLDAEAVEVSAVGDGKDGPATALEADTSYVAILNGVDTSFIRYTAPGAEWKVELDLHSSPSLETEVNEFLEPLLSKEPMPKRIILFMDDGIESAQFHKLFNRLVVRLGRRVEVRSFLGTAD